MRTPHQPPAQKVRQLVSDGLARRYMRLLLVPLVGIMGYVALYVMATLYYPGGSNADRSQAGFDWVHNYWCDLISHRAKNGLPNTARSIAMSGMVMLFASLGVFWYYLPVFFHEKRANRIVIRTVGTIAMFVLLFIATPYHDLVIAVGGGLSSIPVAGVLRELYLNRWYRLFALGVGCGVLIGLNFVMYLTGWAIDWLPLIQKLTFALILIWIFLIVTECRYQLKTGVPVVA